MRKKKAKAPLLGPVESSAFTHVGYDPETRALRVKFHSGKTYEYRGVSAERAETLMGSASMGRYFADQIKPHHTASEIFD